MTCDFGTIYVVILSQTLNPFCFQFYWNVVKLPFPLLSLLLLVFVFRVSLFPCLFLPVQGYFVVSFNLFVWYTTSCMSFVSFNLLCVFHPFSSPPALSFPSLPHSHSGSGKKKLTPGGGERVKNVYYHLGFRGG